jgi:hypothetical protein
MNVPGRAEDSWRWRCTKQMLSRPAFEWFRELTTTSSRSAEPYDPQTGGMVQAAS